MNDAILEFLKMTDKFIVASLARNAGAGGVMMAMAADIGISYKKVF